VKSQEPEPSIRRKKKINEVIGRRSRECFIKLPTATHQALDRSQESTVKEEAVKEPTQDWSNGELKQRDDRTKRKKKN
jgi:hypothetical protein